MTTPEQSDEQKQDQVATSEDDLEADVSIPASFDEVMQAVTDGYGTHPRHKPRDHSHRDMR